MAISGVSSPSTSFAYAAPSEYFTPSTEVCNFRGLGALPIEQALAHLSVIAKKAPVFFIENYEKFPSLSGEQALPFFITVAKVSPYTFIENYRKFPPLKVDEVLALLRIVMKAISSYSRKPGGEYTLKSLLETVNEFNPITKELTGKFLAGQLKTSDDIPVIEHIIQYSAFFHAPTRADIELIFTNVSKETAYDMLVALIMYRKDLFLTHLDYIFANLTTTCVAELSGRIDKTEFLGALDCEEIKRHLEKDFPLIWTEFCEFQRSEQIELRKKDGALWTCIKRKKQTEGYDYTFVFRPEYLTPESFRRKMSDIYPAVEPRIEAVAHYLGYPFILEFFFKLGYLLGNTNTSSVTRYDDKILISKQYNTITIPDRDALLYRYNQLRTLSPSWAHLPELSITSSKGIASDMDFVQALVQSDGLISDEKEFIHDHFAHIVPLLMTARNGSEFYEEIKKQKISWFQSYISKIDFIKKELEKADSPFFTEEDSREFKRNLPILETLLGAMVDTIQNKEFNPGVDVSTRLYSFKQILTLPQWVYYLENRYSKESEGIPKFEIGIIRRLAELIDELHLMN